MATGGKQIKVEFDTEGQKKEELYDRVLVAVGRSPNAEDLGLENTKVSFDDKGFIHVNEQAADHRPGDLRHRRHRGRRAAGAQGLQGSAHRGGGDRRARTAPLPTSPFRRWSSPIRSWPGAG